MVRCVHAVRAARYVPHGPRASVFSPALSRAPLGELSAESDSGKIVGKYAAGSGKGLIDEAGKQSAALAAHVKRLRIKTTD